VSSSRACRTGRAGQIGKGVRVISRAYWPPNSHRTLPTSHRLRELLISAHPTASGTDWPHPDAVTPPGADGRHATLAIDDYGCSTSCLYGPLIRRSAKRFCGEPGGYMAAL
jgi:hypothetical protein